MFTLKISTGNDAFADPGGAYELERLLKLAGETVRFNVCDASVERASAQLRDRNGNTVGEWSLNHEDADDAHSPPEDPGTAPDLISQVARRDFAARAVYAARPGVWLAPEERAISWDEAQIECPARIARIFADVDAVTKAFAAFENGSAV